MASGSYGGDGTNGIGTGPVGFNAWDKWQLGWLTPGRRPAQRTARASSSSGRRRRTTSRRAAVFAKLPPSRRRSRSASRPSAHARVVLGHGRRLQGGSRPDGRRPGRHDHPHVQDVVRGGARLRLRVPPGLHRRRTDVGQPRGVHRDFGRERRRRLRLLVDSGGADVDRRRRRASRRTPARRSRSGSSTWAIPASPAAASRSTTSRSRTALRRSSRTTSRAQTTTAGRRTTSARS